MTTENKNFFRWDVRAEDEQRQIRLLHLYTILIVMFSIGYGIYRLTIKATFFLAVEQLICGVVLIVNWLLYWVHRRVILAQHVVAFISVITIIITQTESVRGEVIANICWLLMYPPAVYLLMGVKRGTFYNVLLLAGFAVVELAVRLGIIAGIYTPFQFLHIWVALFCFILLGFVAELAWERSRREVIDQRERLRVIIEDLPAGIIMAESPNGQISAANDNASRLLGGRPISANIGRDGFSVAYGLTREDGLPYPDRDLPLFSALSGGGSTMRSDIFATRPSGDRAVLRVAAAPIPGASGQPMAAVSFIEDVTKEHEVDKMKSEFVSLASHQLKTPLTSFKWSVESLLDGGLGALTEGQRDVIDGMSVATERLLHLVADLLSVSRIETGRKFNIVPAPTDVAPILKGIVRESESAALKKGVSLVMLPSLPESLMLEVDADKIREAFTNLVGNAVKYSKEGGQVEIGLESGQKEGKAVLYVKDAGIGIPHEQQSKIFEKFFRASNVHQDTEGSGLGLYIVKSIVEKYGGRIWFVSEEDVGTAFYVELPMLPEASR